MARPLSRDVATFLRDHIHSVEQLEVLLLLRGHPARSWTPAEVAAELRTNTASVAARLRDLLASRLVAEETAGTDTEPARYVYAPATAELVSAATQVANAYAAMRYAVIEQILAKPTDKVRLFADAFRLRGPKGDDDDDG